MTETIKPYRRILYLVGGVLLIAVALWLYHAYSTPTEIMGMIFAIMAGVLFRIPEKPIFAHDRPASGWRRYEWLLYLVALVLFTYGRIGIHRHFTREDDVRLFWESTFILALGGYFITAGLLRRSPVIEPPKP